MNLCVTCGEDFTGVRDFDSHRLGKFPQKGASEYRDRPEAKLEDWRPALGRRCLDVEELEAKGWARDARGRWSAPASLRGRIRSQRRR